MGNKLYTLASRGLPRFAWAGGTFFPDRKKINSLLRLEKKVLVVCLAGAQSFLRPEKKVLVVCLAGVQSLLRPEKNNFLVICLAGAQLLLFYHGSDLRKIIQFLRKIECIEFECNEFVLVLFINGLIHFEHPICISSTLIKTNTNPLVQLQYIRYI